MPRTATTAEVRQAYAKLARERHPDRFADPAEKAQGAGVLQGPDHRLQHAHATTRTGASTTRASTARSRRRRRRSRATPTSAALQHVRGASSSTRRSSSCAPPSHHAPDEARYHAALGQALARNPHWVREAHAGDREGGPARAARGRLPVASWRELLLAQGLKLRARKAAEAALRLDPDDARAQRVLDEAGPRTRSRRPPAAACADCSGGRAERRSPADAALPGPAFRCLLSPTWPRMKITYQAVTDVGPQAQGQRGQPLREPRAEPVRGRGRHGRPRRGRGRLQGRGRLHQRVRLPHRRRRGDHLALRPGREHLLRRQPPEDGDPLREPQGPGGHARRRANTRAWPPPWPPCSWTATPPTSATSATAASTSCATASSRQLTSDHSWVNEQIQSGVISADQARSHPAAQRGDARAGRQAGPAGGHAGRTRSRRATSCSSARTGSPP